VKQGNATWNLGTNSVFALGLKKTTENLEARSLSKLYINPVRTSQETHYVSATKPNRLMLFRETVAVYCENLTEHTDALEFWMLQEVTTLEF
jgi:hypothetical protein